MLLLKEWHVQSSVVLICGMSNELMSLFIQVICQGGHCLEPFVTREEDSVTVLHGDSMCEMFPRLF